MNRASVDHACWVYPTPVAGRIILPIRLETSRELPSRNMLYAEGVLDGCVF